MSKHSVRAQSRRSDVPKVKQAFNGCNVCLYERVLGQWRVVPPGGRRLVRVTGVDRSVGWFQWVRQLVGSVGRSPGGNGGES